MQCAVVSSLNVNSAWILKVRTRQKEEKSDGCALRITQLNWMLRGCRHLENPAGITPTPRLHSRWKGLCSPSCLPAAMESWKKIDGIMKKDIIWSSPVLRCSVREHGWNHVLADLVIKRSPISWYPREPFSSSSCQMEANWNCSFLACLHVLLAPSDLVRQILNIMNHEIVAASMKPRSNIGICFSGCGAHAPVAGIGRCSGGGRKAPLQPQQHDFSIALISAKCSPRNLRTKLIVLQLWKVLAPEKTPLFGFLLRPSLDFELRGLKTWSNNAATTCFVERWAEHCHWCNTEIKKQPP